MALDLKPKIRIVEVEDLEGKQKKCLEIRTDTFCGTFPLKEETEIDNRTILFAFVKFWNYVADDQIEEIRLKKVETKEGIEEKLRRFTATLTKPQQLFINLLTKQNGWTPMKTVSTMFERIGDKNAPAALKIAGTGSGLRRKEKKFGLKQIIEVQWNENKKEREYRLNPEYHDILKNILLEEKKG